MLQKLADSMDDEEDAKLSELLETIKDFLSDKITSKHSEKPSDDVTTTSDGEKHANKDKEKETSATHEKSSGKRDLQTFL